MGIESDRLVYDYLSKVGDLAQQRQLPSSERMRLVTELRGEIDRRRGDGDGPAAVRRILSRLGSPDAVVTAAGGAAPAPAGQEWDGTAEDAGQVGGGLEGPERERSSWSRGRRRRLPRQRPAEADGGPGVPEAPELPVYEAVPLDGPSTSRLDDSDDMGPLDSSADWWRIDAGAFGGSGMVPGFTGGVEIPEMLKPPPLRPFDVGKGDATVPGQGDARTVAPVADAPESKARGGWRRLLRSRRPAQAAAKAGGGARARRWTNPLLLLAAALLIAGAAVGNWIALGLGWVIAYASRRLTAAETKGAVVILPGLAAVAGAVWLWGRQVGQWGEPIGDGQMNAAFSETWPWVVRGAALASALFLIWRSQRGRS